MTSQRIISIFLGAVLFVQAAGAADPAKLRGWIVYFKSRDPVADATKNHQDGTIYVFSAMGVGFYYPGIHDSATGDQLAKKHGVKHLPATSDVIESDLHWKYMEVATEYASKYNQTTLKLLGVPNKP
jgi:hypothetical protein